ncbi:hypothetical protein [Acinetobacter sp. AS167]|uniref:hypothetical protein n=1 Tax=Acinetobacter sp. AS167 TaxID=3127884 RepID=UPI0030164795
MTQFLSEESPLEIFKKFKNSLGTHNINFDVLRLILTDYQSTKIQNQNLPTYIRNVAKSYRYHNLFPNDTKYKVLHRYLITSHIIYCYSAIDDLCANILKLSNIKQFRINQKKVLDHIQGNKIHIALSVLSMKSNNLSSLSDLENRVQCIKSERIEFKIVDYYRKIRNQQAHDFKMIENPYSELNIPKIEDKYKLTPNNYENLNEDDVKIFSFALLDIAQYLCSIIYDYKSEIKPYLIHRYYKDDKKRRQNGIRALLRQNFLFENYEISCILEDIG